MSKVTTMGLNWDTGYKYGLYCNLYQSAAARWQLREMCVCVCVWEREGEGYRDEGDEI